MGMKIEFLSLHILYFMIKEVLSFVIDQIGCSENQYFIIK